VKDVEVDAACGEEEVRQDERENQLRLTNVRKYLRQPPSIF
jgi:hypothetical protein